MNTRKYNVLIVGSADLDDLQRAAATLRKQGHSVSFVDFVDLKGRESDLLSLKEKFSSFCDVAIIMDDLDAIRFVSRVSGNRVAILAVVDGDPHTKEFDRAPYREASAVMMAPLSNLAHTISEGSHTMSAIVCANLNATQMPMPIMCRMSRIMSIGERPSTEAQLTEMESRERGFLRI